MCSQVLQFNGTCNKYGFRFSDWDSNNSCFGSKWQCTVLYAAIVQGWNLWIGADCFIDFGCQRHIENGSKVWYNIDDACWEASLIYDFSPFPLSIQFFFTSSKMCYRIHLANDKEMVENSSTFQILKLVLFLDLSDLFGTYCYKRKTSLLIPARFYRN